MTGAQGTGGQGRVASPALVLAAVAGTVVLAGAGVLRVAIQMPTFPLPDRLVPTLLGAAILLVGLLAIPRLPGLAWGAIALATPIGAIEVVSVIRSLEELVSSIGTVWRDLTLIAGLALVSAALVCTGYAARDASRASPIARVAIALVALGAVATVAMSAWAVVDASQPAARAFGELSPLRIAVRVALATVAAGFLVGLGRTLGPAAARASARSMTGTGARDFGLWRFLGLLADELLPARTDARRAAAEEERARLAADLHAHVLPELRRMAAAAESAGAPPDMQVDLRRALEDVEQLMHQRQSIVLEQFGLVAALEWLAERTEERSRIRVQLELGDGVPDGPRAVDPRIARAAFRIALLGLDNVVRHAGATTATLRLGLQPGALRLTVEDDGVTPSFEPSGGRGIADMRTAAAESGGAIRFTGDAGARVEATWPFTVAARNHAPNRAVATDRSEQRPA
jgi:signal transduction histidine kinase